MKWTVLWRPRAERQLARIWLEVGDRQAVRAAADSLDGQLSQSPMSAGESRSGNVRVAFASPLGVELEVVEQDRIVYVLSVWRIGARRDPG